MQLDPTRRMYRPVLADLPPELEAAASRVCPFSDDSLNENGLGVPHPTSQHRSHSLIGPYLSTVAGRVSSTPYLDSSSSGGLASWFLSRICKEGKVDRIISVARVHGSDELFRYQIVQDPSDPNTRKSHYYATSMHAVLDEVLSTDLRYALVGVPCFIKAARSLCRERHELASRISLFVGLVCGHMKTQAFGESMAWQLGIPPARLTEIDFRVKNSTRPAQDYSFGARAEGETAWRTKPIRELIGANWGHSAFQPSACDFCDDVVAETSDITFGDAWLPRFADDPRGTSIVIIRNEALRDVFARGEEGGEIDLCTVSADEVAASQAGGFRHRRAGLAVRLADDIAAGHSVPAKRVEPDAIVVAPQRARLIRHRRKLAVLSHEAYQEARRTGDLAPYTKAMRRAIRAHIRIESPLMKRVLVLVWSWTRRLAGSFPLNSRRWSSESKQHRGAKRD